MLYQRLQVRSDGHFCAVPAVADMLRSVCLTYRSTLPPLQGHMGFTCGIDDLVLSAKAEASRAKIQMGLAKMGNYAQGGFAGPSCLLPSPYS